MSACAIFQTYLPSSFLFVLVYMYNIKNISVGNHSVF